MTASGVWASLSAWGRHERGAAQSCSELLRGAQGLVTNYGEGGGGLQNGTGGGGM